MAHIAGINIIDCGVEYHAFNLKDHQIWYSFIFIAKDYFQFSTNAEFSTKPPKFSNIHSNSDVIQKNC